MGKLYTLGHGVLSLGDFLLRLKSFGIDVLLDCRSTPWYKPGDPKAVFNENSLPAELSRLGIRYVPMGRYFGDKPSDSARFTLPVPNTPYFVIDYRKEREREEFRRAVDNVISGVRDGHNVALLGIEENPLSNFVCLFLSPVFAAKNCHPIHIEADGSSLSQEEFEDRLLRLYSLPPYENNGDTPASLLSEGPALPEGVSPIDEAYRRRNIDIAPRKKFAS